MARSDYPTAEELIATLQRSQIQTVLIDGATDVFVYRRIEKRIPDHNIDFLPCNGRTALLQIYQRRHEITAFFSRKDAG